ncbi:hypothetical protein LBMAG42_51510 [Deltaproteobacteria bacterium]|nr:hypothetical protein LBMAG42_51510 [Deltaproteobacteria bacterium]
MLWLTQLAFGIAIADSGNSCFSGGQTVFSVPTPAATDVPIDVQPAFVFTENSCGEIDAELVLATERGQEIATRNLDVSDGLGELQLEQTLADSTAFVFTSTTFVSTATVGFTTGTAEHSSAGVVPTVESFTATWTTDPPQLELRADVAYSGAGGADLIAQWVDGPEGDVTLSTFTRVGAPGLTDSASWVSRTGRSNAPKTWCLLAKTRELDGSWTEGETECVDVAEAGVCGCNGADSGATAAATSILIAGAAAIRRRSR